MKVTHYGPRPYLRVEYKQYSPVGWNRKAEANQTGISKMYLGTFDSEEAARRAYVDAAKKCFGEFARCE